MPRDVNQKILFLEMLADAAGNAAEKTDSGRGNGRFGDENARVEVALIDGVVEGAHLLGTDAAVIGAEFDVDCATVRLGLAVGRCGERRVFRLHGFGRAGLDL